MTSNQPTAIAVSPQTETMENANNASAQGGEAAQIEQAVCRVCGAPIVRKRSSDVLCPNKACQVKNAARRVRECKARRAARRSRAKALRNRVHHLPARTLYKLILIDLLAKQNVANMAKALHSQAPLPAERGATDELDAVRRLSETSRWRESIRSVDQQVKSA